MTRTPLLAAAAAVALLAADAASAQVSGLVASIGSPGNDRPVRYDTVPGSGTYTDLLGNAQAAGLTFDGTRLLGAEAGDLYEYGLDGSRSLVAPIEFNGFGQFTVGLAYDPNTGVLYGSDSGGGATSDTPEGIYTIDTTTGVSTQVLNVNTAAVARDFSIGGLAFDSVNNVLYGSDNDDGGVGRGIFAIDLVNQSLDLLVAYPDGVTDVDGLAYGDGKLWLATDPAEDYYSYDLASGTYASFTGAFDASFDELPFGGASEGAAFIPPVPEPASLALLGLAGLGLTRRR